MKTKNIQDRIVEILESHYKTIIKTDYLVKTIHKEIYSTIVEDEYNEYIDFIIFLPLIPSILTISIQRVITGGLLKEIELFRKSEKLDKEKQYK